MRPPRVNDAITARLVRLVTITEDGAQERALCLRDDARARARERGMDLVALGDARREAVVCCALRNEPVKDAIAPDRASRSGVIVFLRDEQGRESALSGWDAFELAEARGLWLALLGPAESWEVAECGLARVARPPRWERGLPEEVPVSPPRLDPDLWFTAEHGECAGERHFIHSNAHSFRGRFYAHCPARARLVYCSAGEVRECSREARYWLKGFLAGQEPDAPHGQDGGTLPFEHADMQAWLVACERFQQTGYWVEAARACARCGAWLLPSNPGEVCAECVGEPRA